MKKLYIFDFDGTLVNTFYDSVIAYNKALNEHGLNEYEYESLDVIDFEDFITTMTHDEEVLKTYAQIYEDSVKENTMPYPNIIDTLTKLQDRGVDLAICSNRIQNQLEQLVNKLFPNINFKYVIGYVYGTDAKPHPDMMNKIIKHEPYNLDEIIYIGDRTTDIETAENVEVDTIIVKWGQGNKEAYNNPYPIKVIDNASQLLDIE